MRKRTQGPVRGNQRQAFPRVLQIRVKTSWDHGVGKGNLKVAGGREKAMDGTGTLEGAAVTWGRNHL